MRAIPEIFFHFVECAEGGFVAHPYRDSGGVLTGPYGHTGPDVVEGMTFTPAQGRAYLEADAQTARARLYAVVHEASILSLTDDQYSAILSFVFNVGIRPGWGVVADLNALRLDDVPSQLRRFDKVKVRGKLVDVPGLDHRRQAEITLWRTGDTAAAVVVAQAAPIQPPPSHVVRAMDITPSQAADPKPVMRPANVVRGGLSAGGALGTWGLLSGHWGGVVHAIAPFAPLIAAALAVVLGLVLAAFVITHRQRHVAPFHDLHPAPAPPDGPGPLLPAPTHYKELIDAMSAEVDAIVATIKTWPDKINTIVAAAEQSGEAKGGTAAAAASAADHAQDVANLQEAVNGVAGLLAVPATADPPAADPAAQPA